MGVRKLLLWVEKHLGLSLRPGQHGFGRRPRGAAGENGLLPGGGPCARSLQWCVRPGGSAGGPGGCGYRRADPGGVPGRQTPRRVSAARKKKQPIWKEGRVSLAISALFEYNIKD